MGIHWECDTHSSFWTRSRDAAADHELSHENCEIFSVEDEPDE